MRYWLREASENNKLPLILSAALSFVIIGVQQESADPLNVFGFHDPIRTISLQ